MDQNNYGPFGIFFYYGPIFLVRHMCGGFFVLVQNFDRESRARSACDDRLRGEKARNGFFFFLNLSGKLGMGLPGHI